MSVSTKELFTAFFKGLAFAKGLNFGEKNRGMAEDRWITIHPGGDEDNYRRIEINDETGEIEKGLGAGTNIKDLSKTLKAKKNGEEAETTSKKDDTNLSDLARKIKALTDGKEYTEEVAKKEAEEKKGKEEDLFKKYWAESVSAGLYQKRKEAEENKKTEESKKSEQKNTEPEKSSFKEKLRKILSTPFKKSRSDSTYHEVNPERIRSVVSKLNPDDPKTEEALKELEKYYNEGQAWAVNEVVDNIDNYTSNPESYERKLKANEKSLNKSLDIFNKVTDKINSLVQNDLKKFTDFMYERGKTFGSKLSKEQIGEKIKNMLKEGRLRSLMESRGFKSEGLRLANKIADTKNSLKSSLESIKNFNPARAPLFSINLQKQHIKDLKDDVENYLKANNMAMDSADFAEIQALLNEMDNGNNSLDLFINNVNIER